jgi:hypothetical protein
MLLIGAFINELIPVFVAVLFGAFKLGDFRLAFILLDETIDSSAF